MSAIEKSTIITTFAGQARICFYGRGREVKVQSVAEAVAAISKTIELVGQQIPVYSTQEEYILPVKRCIKGMRRNDAPLVLQLAVPVSLPHECFNITNTSSDPNISAAADLALIVLYYLLRVG